MKKIISYFKKNFLRRILIKLIRIVNPSFMTSKILHDDLRSNLIFGKNTIISYLSQLDSKAPITIGSDCLISDGVKIFTHTHYTWSNKQFSMKDTHTISKNPIIIEDNVVIYANALIMPSVERIHKSCMILSGAVLTKSTTGPYQIWAGNPAKLIKIKQK